MGGHKEALGASARVDQCYLNHTDSIAVLTQGFQQCPDVGHFLVGEHVRALRTADERRDAVTPIQFPAEHKHYGRIFYKTPMMGVFYAPEEHRIVDVNQYFKSLI